MLDITSWPRIIHKCHRTYARLSRSRSFVHRNLRQQSTKTTAKTNFLEIEKRWKSKWDLKGTKIQQGKDYKFSDGFLVPLYMDHICQKNMLGTLQSMYTSGTRPMNGGSSVLEEILFTSRFISSNSNYEYSQKYGSEIVRACVLFGQENDAARPLSEQSLLDTQDWFEQVRYAVQVARQSFEDNQAHCLHSPSDPDPDDRSNPHLLDDIIEYSLKSTESLIRIPPSYMPLFDGSFDNDACALSIASQKAISVMIQKSKPVNYHNLWRELNRLVIAIMYYDHCHRVECVLHYHSARILLSLIAIIAPSFAEECWVILQYGTDQIVTSTCDGEGNRTAAEEIGATYVNDWEHDDIEDLGLQHLPRTNNPGTLPSIFAQRFPELAASEELRTLQRLSIGSELNCMVDNVAKIDEDRFKGMLMRKQN